MDIFDRQGHLTDDALRYLIDGAPDQLQRLEISEHLSFCDDCLMRYAALVSEEAENTAAPSAPILPAVMGEIKKRAFREAFNRYVVIGVAACIALVFWFGGVFNIGAVKDKDHTFILSEQTAQLSEKTASFTGAISEKLNEFLFNNNERK